MCIYIYIYTHTYFFFFKKKKSIQVKQKCYQIKLLYSFLKLSPEFIITLKAKELFILTMIGEPHKEKINLNVIYFSTSQYSVHWNSMVHKRMQKNTQKKNLE